MSHLSGPCDPGWNAFYPLAICRLQARLDLGPEITHKASAMTPSFISAWVAMMPGLVCTKSSSCIHTGPFWGSLFHLRLLASGEEKHYTVPCFSLSPSASSHRHHLRLSDTLVLVLCRVWPMHDLTKIVILIVQLKHGSFCTSTCCVAKVGGVQLSEQQALHKLCWRATYRYASPRSRCNHTHHWQAASPHHTK